MITLGHLKGAGSKRISFLVFLLSSNSDFFYKLVVNVEQTNIHQWSVELKMYRTKKWKIKTMVIIFTHTHKHA